MSEAIGRNTLASALQREHCVAVFDFRSADHPSNSSSLYLVSDPGCVIAAKSAVRDVN